MCMGDHGHCFSLKQEATSRESLGWMWGGLQVSPHLSLGPKFRVCKSMKQVEMLTQILWWVIALKANEACWCLLWCRIASLGYPLHCIIKVCILTYLWTKASLLAGETLSCKVFEFSISEAAEFHRAGSGHGIQKLEARGQIDFTIV